MAEIVLGLGSSHAPHLSTPVELWAVRGHIDEHLRRVDRFDDLATERASWIGPELTIGRWQQRYDAVQEAIAELNATLTRKAADVVVTVGDDQREMFTAGHVPAIDIYWGESLENVPPDSSTLSEVQRSAIWAEYGTEPTTYPGEAHLGRHLIKSLTREGFDVSHTAELHDGQKIGHAFNFVYRRLMGDRIVPQVPVMVNTFYPPNQPTLRRCYELGHALRRAIISWGADKRVALIASGGLTHPVIDEELDGAMLDGMREKDPEKLLAYPGSLFVNGTSEIRNWVVVAAAMEDCPMRLEVVDYQPLYRSRAGTGVGACFARWV